ncbi:GntR family transcriptional regulator [Methylobacterium nodulans]|uniref:Transcriptional regulator, GntR family n=1 Tax=Methylobacterium nodulans (strain LMG 21967 / CNCM I-2342 / ORS 2060) TaxID=460265 RepID=B8ICD3_METNO|nr:GntR family transcriptional regulator [Methylobacterium nodulans]ACL55521.1 transcriptional regulator, GntR family [Methylobacterium nodulans ORS 2060]
MADIPTPMMRKAPNRIPSTPRPGRAPSAATVICQELRTEIASLARLPGQPINEKEIAARYGVSRTPVHEAMLKLADEGLVEIFPQAGTYVARIPYRDLPEVIVIRRALEESSARLAAEHAKPADLAALDRIMVALDEAAADQDREAFRQRDEDFHAAVAGAAGYPGLWRLTRQVKIQVDRFRRLTLPQPGRFARILIEHRAVLDAIRARDPAAACAAMGAHLDGLLAELGGIAWLNAEYFDMSGIDPPVLTETDKRDEGVSGLGL